MAKNILITGCNGYLARNLISHLKNRRYKIICIGRNSDINLYDYDKVSNAVKNSHAIVHLAAITNPFDKDIWKVNFEYTKFLVKEAEKFNKKFIYLSTQNVLFGKDNYSKSKGEAEKLVKNLKNYVILRPTIIYGKDENRYIGKLINLIKKSFFIPIIGNGSYKLQPIYVLDLVKIIENCINNNIKGIYLIAGDSIIIYNKLADLIIKKLNLFRLKLHIPIFALRLFAFLFETFSSNPLITNVQLNNIKINQNYDINLIKKVFKIKLKTIEQGLNEII